MDIGPITGIGPILPTRPSGAAPDLSRVFEVEYLGESPEEQYEASRQRASRGLEDEEDLEGESQDEDQAADNEDKFEVPPLAAARISFFA